MGAVFGLVFVLLFAHSAVLGNMSKQAYPLTAICL